MKSIARFFDQHFAFIGDVDNDKELVRLDDVVGDIFIVPIKDSETGKVLLWPFGVSSEDLENGKGEARLAIWGCWPELSKAMEAALLPDETEEVAHG